MRFHAALRRGALVVTHSTEHPISLVLASAGTGKTYRLCSEYAGAVLGGVDGRAALDPERILVTTFTVKAAGELLERCRAALLAAGATGLADRLMLGRIGTVNAIGGRLLSEFAIDLGLSPICDVLAEDQARAAFRVAAESAIEAARERMEPVAWRLGLHEAERPDGESETWADVVGRVVQLARQNGIPSSALAGFAARSTDGLLALLPPPFTSGDALDNSLQTAIDQACEALARSTDTTASTITAREVLEQARHTLAVQEALPWSVWAKLAKLKPGKASVPLVEPVRAAAAEHCRHPRLRADLSAMIKGVFKVAAEADEQYALYKRAFGLVDFADQERLVLEALDQTDIRARLGERLGLVLVDEFQDTRAG